MIDGFHEEQPWAGLLAYVTGMVNQQLLLQNEYLIAENRILRGHEPTRLRLSNPQRSTLAEIGKRMGRKALEQVACVAKPDTILAWYRRLVARKFDGSRQRSDRVGRQLNGKLWSWWSRGRERILAGVTIGSLELWRTSATWFRIKP